MQQSDKKLVQIALTINIFEWYDFCISSYLAVTMGQVFFASDNPILAVIQSFAVFALGYLVRPLGSILFGYLGDKFSSGFALKYSTIMMAIPTIFIAILPVYHTIGYLAPLLLIFFRMIQGIAAGGELPICSAYVFEHSQKQRNSTTLCGLTNTGAILGILLASSVVLCLHLLFTQTAIYNWAWRLPFLLSLPLFLAILYFRKSMNLTGRHADNNKIRIRGYAKAFTQTFFLIAFAQVSFYIILIWLPTYLQYFLGVPSNYARISNVVALATFAAAIALFGYLGRFINYKRLIIAGAVLLTILVYPLFLLLPMVNFGILLLIQIIFALLLASVSGLYFFTIGNLFPANIRNQAMAIGFTIPTTLFGGTAPLICSYIIHKLGFMLFPSFYIIAFGILAIVTLITI
ncbi:MAG: MFS transporter [Burkholderiales bacterium]|nr:MFS transporter [Burkholderiales bacterium]